MDLSKLTYSKNDSRLAPKPPVLQPIAKNEEDGLVHESSGVAPAYQKSEGVLSTSLIFVLSGGEKKEKDFLRELILKRELRSLRVVFMSEKGQGLQPYQMQEKWEQIRLTGEIKIESQLFHLDAMDKVFLLSDVDEFHDQLVKIFEGIQNETQGKWIISNPCFEIWLYYCYLNNPEKDLECLKAEPAATRSKKMKAMGNALVNGGLNPCLAFENMLDGIEHSIAHYAEDDCMVPVLYATQMHEMAQYLVDAMTRNADEYSKFVRKKEEWRECMKRYTK